jgi:hypothetical protein
VTLFCSHRYGTVYLHVLCLSWTHVQIRPCDILGALRKLRKTTIRIVMSVCLSAWNKSATTRRIFMKFDIWGFIIHSVEKMKGLLKSGSHNGTLREERHTFFLSYRPYFFLEREMSHTKAVQKIKTHILCSVTFSRKSCRLWDNVESMTESDKPHDIIVRRMCIACWITKARKHTHS